MSRYAFKINGQYVTQEEFANYKPGDELPSRQKPPPRGTNDWKQLVSENMGYDGCVEDAKRLDREYGAPEVDYVQVGPNSYNPVFNDKGTYDKYLAAHGYFNKTSGKGNHSLSGAMLERAAARILEYHDERGTNGGLPRGDSGNIDELATENQ